MSVELLERAAQALAPVLSDVVFLGGASIVLWITDPAAPAPRPTKDSELGRLRAHPRIREGISGALRADFASQARAEAVVLPRLEQLIG